MPRAKQTIAALSLFALAAFFVSGCGGDKNDPVRDAAALNYAAPLTTEAVPSEIALGIYQRGKYFMMTDAALGEKREGIQRLCCAYEREPIIALEKVKGADDDGPYFVESTADGPVNPHRDFLVGMLAAGGIDKEQVFLPPSGAFTLELLAKRARWALSPKELLASPAPTMGKDGNELGWSFLALARLTDLDETWANRLGEKLTAEDLLHTATSRGIGWGSCDGTHELMGLAAMLAAYEAGHTGLKGEWLTAREYLDRAIETARKNQAETGAFGPEWYKKKSETPSTADAIFYTGHVLDWLIPALPKDELSAPWVKKSVTFLAEEMNFYMNQIMERPEHAFHAAHALQTYLDRTTPPKRNPRKWLSKKKYKQRCPYFYCQES